MHELQHSSGQKGAVTIFAAVGAMMVLGFAAIVIDVGQAITTKTALQNIADTAVLSGSRELGRIYDEKGNFNYQKYTLTSADKARIVANVNEFTIQNTAGGVHVAVPAGDVHYGAWNDDTGQVEEKDTGVDAIWVRARRDDTANGPLNTLLAGLMGIDEFSMTTRSSSAAVSAVKWVPSGWGDIPVGISKHWFETRDSPCGGDSQIRFYPTGTTLGCAGWHTFVDPVTSADNLREILRGLKNGTFKAPEITADQTYFNFTGGTLAGNFNDMVDLYDAKKGADGTWQIHIPVYDRNDCTNPNQSIKIVGLATARVTAVNRTAKTIDGVVECDVTPIGKGGGVYYGTAVAVAQRMLE